MNEEWIEADEELPETEDLYLVLWQSDLFPKARFYGLCQFYEEEGFWLKSINHIKNHMQYNPKITHWMPLPEMIKREN